MVRKHVSFTVVAAKGSREHSDDGDVPGPVPHTCPCLVYPSFHLRWVVFKPAKLIALHSCRTNTRHLEDSALWVVLNVPTQFLVLGLSSSLESLLISLPPWKSCSDSISNLRPLSTSLASS